MPTADLHDPLLAPLDIIGVFAFAISGGIVAVKQKMDIFGVGVLACATAVSGGIVRDLILGEIPPEAFRNPELILVAAFAALICFFGAAGIHRLRYAVLTFDAAGLSLTAVAGTQKALHHGIEPLLAGVLGLIGCIGGGIVRDVLASQPPEVLRSGFYASAAIAAILVILVAYWAGVQTSGIAIPAAGLCFGLRIAAIYRGWRLPVTPQDLIDMLIKRKHQ